jgi:hypothetical protein
MKILEIDEALNSCEQHLTSTNTAGTEIEALLTRAAVVLTCSAFEEQIEQIISRRAERLDDPAMVSFCKSCIKAVFRSTFKSDLAGLINRFGPKFKEHFNSLIQDHAKAVTFYDNIITNRQGVAHTKSLNITLKELREFYEEGHIILDFFNETINATYPR